MKISAFFLGLLMTATCWAAPSPKDLAKFQALLPAGQTLVDTLELKLPGTAAISEKDSRFYLYILPKGSKSLQSVTTMDKKNSFQEPIQGPHQEKLSKLIYTRDLDHNGTSYLFVHTYLADVTGLHVFKATPKGYQEIFREGTIAEFTFDAKTGRLSRPATDADPAQAWQWKKGRFLPTK